MDFDDLDDGWMWEQGAVIYVWDVRNAQDLRVCVLRSSFYVPDMELYVN
jgi:hypothetical protein